MEKITITIDKEIYKKLAQMKLDQDLRTFDEVLDFMLKKMKSKEKKNKSKDFI